MFATSSVKKRKVDIEHRAFNPAWKEKYFFIERFGQAQCLICLNTVAVLKEFNTRRHWNAENRASHFASTSSAERKYAIDRLSSNLRASYEVQCNDELKAKFYNSPPLSFFRDFALPSSNFPKYIAHVQRIVAMFGGTYCCEQLFSKMKYTKSRLRSLLSDRHLNNILLLSSSSIKPDIEILLHGKQHQSFHRFACFAIKVL